MRMMSSFILVGILASVTLGCSGSKSQLSPVEVWRRTTRTIESTYSHVFRATNSVLKEHGYIISRSDINTGLIDATIADPTHGSQFLRSLFSFFVKHVDDKEARIDVGISVKELGVRLQEVRILIEKHRITGGEKEIDQVTDENTYEELFEDIAAEVKRRESMGE
jgi:hypothetical protein